MATRAHSTRTPLLPPPGATPPLLPRGLGRQPGPVTIALAAMHAADPERQHIRELRRRISERIEADIALLDALDGDTDFEAVNEDGGDICDEPHDEDTDREPSLCGITCNALFATGASMSAHEAEPSLASLGGTAAGCDQPQTGWDRGDLRDREEDTGSRTHRREALFRETGPALTEARERADRLARRRRRGDEVRIIGPWGGTYNVAAIGRR